MKMEMALAMEMAVVISDGDGDGCIYLVKDSSKAQVLTNLLHL